MAKGKWKPVSQVFGETRKYIAGRQIDMNAVQHAGNMEYHGDYTEDRDSVTKLCEELNEEAAIAE